MSTSYSISTLAEEFDVTPRTLRFYEAQGILSPRREGTRRLFSQRDRVRLRLVVRGKRLGFSLAELKNIIDMYDSEVGEAGQLQYLLQRIHEQCAALEQKRQDINETLEELHMTAARCIEGLAEKYGHRSGESSQTDVAAAMEKPLNGVKSSYSEERRNA
ncbi:MAG: MerR family DNA-binding transcriptional regulator [Gammaproteobacteria bacterium]|nr:MerR family DNA-binding transcriptional regulator [Gammaproteobacteria bacterium]